MNPAKLSLILITSLLIYALCRSLGLGANWSVAVAMVLAQVVIWRLL